MARHDSLATSRLIACLAGVAFAACQREPSERKPLAMAAPRGSVVLELHVAAAVGDIHYALAGPNGYARIGDTGPTDGTAVTTIGQLPPGDGYLLTASATSGDGARCSSASPPFSVVAGQIRRISLSLACGQAGGPPGDGGLDVCPSAEAIVASADQVYVGGSLTLTGLGRGFDGQLAPPAFTWTSTSGALVTPSAVDVTLTCTLAGPVTVTVTVAEGDAGAACPASSLSITVPCLPAIEQIGHIVVIYLENHSFDSLYGSFPGAEGLLSPMANVPQIDDATGLPYPTLPQSDPSVPLDLPNRSFDLAEYVPPNQKTIDLVHRFYQEQQQIDGGRMDRFVTVSDAKGLVLGAYPTVLLPVARLAADNPGQTTLCDHFFHAAFGGSFLNHQWLIAAATPVFPSAPTALVATVDAAGNLLGDGAVTPDGFAVNALDPTANPHTPGASPDSAVPPQFAATIGDRLTAAGVDWGWYAGGWDDALAGNPDPLFIPPHHPFTYFAAYAEGTAARAAHLKDESALAGEIAAGTLPPVVFVKPLGTSDEHPGLTDLLSGEDHAVALLESLMGSSFWNDTVVILTYDENGGFWDHVPPPVADRWGPGTRIPALIFSPLARGGIDSTVYDTTAIPALIEKRWNLPPLAARDAAQADLSAHALRLSR